jgi:hypothetical protein
MARLSSHFGIQDPRLQSLTFPLITVTTNTTDANQTYTTANVLGGLILRQLGASRTDTLPTAAALVEAVQGAMVGTAFRFTIRNTSSGAYTITVAGGTGITTSGTMTIAQNNTKEFLLVFTNVGINTEAATLYSIGTFVH